MVLYSTHIYTSGILCIHKPAAEARICITTGIQYFTRNYHWLLYYHLLWGSFYQCCSVSNPVRICNIFHSEAYLPNGCEGENVEAVGALVIVSVMFWQPAQKPALSSLLFQTTDCEKSSTRMNWTWSYGTQPVYEPFLTSQKEGQLYSVCVVIPTSGLSLCVLTASTFKLMDSTLQPEPTESYDY